MKKQKLLPVVLLAVLVVGLGGWILCSKLIGKSSSASGGYDTSWYNAASDTYQILDAEDLAGLAVLVNEQGVHFSGKTVLLAADISLSGTDWTPIGREEAPFMGTFDGQGHTVSGLTLTADTEAPAGLFGVVAQGTVQDVVVNGSVRGTGAVGGIIGSCSESSVRTCCTVGAVSGESAVGGVVGSCTDSLLDGCCSIGPVGSGTAVGGIAGTVAGADSTITDCYSMGAITGTHLAGGVVGELLAGTLEGCYSTGTVTGKDGTAGGIAGAVDGTVSNCYAEGSVSGEIAGGIAGCLRSGNVTHCYTTGSVSAADYAGGLVGQETGGSVLGCFALGNVDATWAGGLAGSVSGTLTGCYTAGAVTGTTAAGGAAGSLEPSGLIQACYYDLGSTPSPNSSDLAVGLPTTQMTAATGTSAEADWAAIGSDCLPLVDALNLQSEDWVQNLEQNNGYPFIGYLVTFETGSETFTQGVVMGDRLQRPQDPVRDGFLFQGWYTGDTLWTFESAVTTDLVLTAGWETDNSTLPHSITIADDIGLGTITVSADTALRGETVTVTATPEAECGLEALTVVSSRDLKQALRAVDANQFSFSMPADDVTVHAVFVKEPLPFADLPEAGELHDAVMQLYKKGYMSGISDTNFSAESTLTRGMLATILYHMAGDPKPVPASSFSDVTRGLWYHDAIAWAAGKDILQGYGNSLFGPDDAVTVEQMVVIFWRYAESPAPGAVQALAGVSDWAAEAMSWATEQGLLTTESLEAPTASATREQIAIFLYRFGILQS